MEFLKDPRKIESKSMAIIAPYLQDLQLSEAEKKIYSRIIHAAGDPEYANRIIMQRDFIAAARQVLLTGKKLICDVRMVVAGINKKRLAAYGSELYCAIDSGEAAVIAKTEGITRSMAAMRILKEELAGSLVVVGNAPTALFELFKLMEAGYRPAAVIGVPVGFVGAAEAKEELEKIPVPFLTVRGTKGGSTIACAVVNALLYLEDDR